MTTDTEAGTAALYTPESLSHCEMQNALGYLIAHVKRRLEDILEQELAPLELTAAQFVVLINLHHQAESTPADFCRLLDYDPGAMTRLIDRIEKKGFIRRVRNPDDRRSVRLELTEAGLALCPQAMPRVCSAFNRLLHGFKPEEARQLESMLQRILANTCISTSL